MNSSSVMVWRNASFIISKKERKSIRIDTLWTSASTFMLEACPSLWEPIQIRNTGKRSVKLLLQSPLKSDLGNIGPNHRSDVPLGHPTQYSHHHRNTGLITDWQPPAPQLANSNAPLPSTLSSVKLFLLTIMSILFEFCRMCQRWTQHSTHVSSTRTTGFFRTFPCHRERCTWSCSTHCKGQWRIECSTWQRTSDKFLSSVAWHLWEQGTANHPRIPELPCHLA